MAREQRRLLIPRPRLQAVAGDGVLPLEPDEARYLTRVLRYQPGDRFAVVDGCGSLWSAVLRGGAQAQLLQPLQQPQQQEPPPRPPLLLVAALVKRDFDLVVRMAVELGVDRLIPLLSAHTAVLGQAKPERWRSIADEAAEQCERLWLPQIDDPLPLAPLLEDPQLQAGVRFWATTRRPELPGLQTLLERTPDAVATEAPLCLACGPEGGWSPEEERQAERAGWQPVQLGPRILRSSTAAVAGFSVLSTWRQRQSGC